MFTPSELFKGVACPAGQHCSLLNCIFSHKSSSEQLSKPSTISQTSVQDLASGPEGIESETAPAAKRRRVTYDRLEDKPPSRADLIRSQLASDRAGAKRDVPKDRSTSQPVAASHASSISSLRRAVSPPPVITKTNETSTAAANTGDPDQQSQWLALKEAGRTGKETLNPRLVNPAPETHAKRAVYIQHIHANMSKLNTEVRDAKEAVDDLDIATMKSLVLNNQELIKLALDEEETIARTNSKLYSNAIRSRLAAYQKMKMVGWLEKLKYMSRPVEPDKTAGKEEAQAIKPIDIGLPSEHEHLILPHLVVHDQLALKQYGYIVTPPSDAEAAEARLAVEACKNHEECDRCGSRFRLLPDRHPETGRLTTNGPCRYHWARKIFPSKQKTDSYTGSNEPMYPCCGQSVGTEGCTVHEEHVYKCSAPSRLAAVMPFINTPENAGSQSDGEGNPVHAVVFDCEMGYTTNGMELIRLTAISWPAGKQLVDVLVRPLGASIDLNTRFSGVKPEQMANAEPYTETDSSDNGVTPRIVENAATARRLLCNFLTPTTPLIGHAIDNDLNATRLCHPAIIDTVLLFSHPRGLPFRFGLKMLAKKHLKRDIQTGGSAGHDSLEDATATGDLVKAKAAEVWSDMTRRGWRVQEGEMINTTDDQACQVPPGWRVSAKKVSKTAKVTQGNRLAQILEEARSESVGDKQTGGKDETANTADVSTSSD